MKDLFGVLGPEMEVTVCEVNVQYWFLAHRLHPNKHGTEATGMISYDAVEMFKLVNNGTEIPERKYYDISRHSSSAVWSCMTVLT